MKIIDIAKCIDNVDPLGIGRIRVNRYNEYTGQKEKAIDYEPWSDRDLFVANPFLPANINFIPEIGQSVKILNYDTDSDTVNVEYVAGPFTTNYDFNGQTFSQQIANTTYGTNVKHKPRIRNSTGQYINKKSENTFATDRDYAIYGKYGSDLLFTENGLQLRGGKLLAKEAASPQNREILLDYPLMSKKSSRLFLKKFPKKMTIEEELVTNSTIDSKNINYIVEYEVDKLKNLTEVNYATIKIYVYKVLSQYGNTFNTNYFTEHSTFDSNLVKLITTGTTSSSPTYTATGSSINDIYREIRDKIFLIHDKGLKELNSLYPEGDVHPLYFRPSSSFKTMNTDETENIGRQSIFNNINVLRVGPSSGLIWSATRAKPETNKVESIEKKYKINPNSPEQTFGTIMSDKFYLLSTDLGKNELDNPVPFNDLNGYDLTQEDYVKRIESGTFSTVRGENLVEVLRAIVNVLYSHIHNPLMPIAGQSNYQDGNTLMELIKTLENDILNKSIRIN
jgi:hypothetical protein